MKIVVLNGSPHKEGNTTAMVSAFEKGAVSAGHEVAVLPVGTMKIAPCLGCEYCHGAGEGQCVQKDDMGLVNDAIADADMIVFASPVHYWGFSGQMQSVICRFYPTEFPKADKFALLLSSGSPGCYAPIEMQYKSMLLYFKGENLGIYELAGEKNKDPFYLAEIEVFGASL